jgi:hypothetical protein
VEVVKDGVQIANVSAPGAVLGEQAVLLDQPHCADVRTLEQSEFVLCRRRACDACWRSNRRPLRGGNPRATTGCRQPITDRGQALAPSWQIS